jgi:hypothetical protein
MTGHIYYRQTQNSTILAKAKNEINNAFPHLPNINLTWAFIATWYNDTYYPDNLPDYYPRKRDIFQATLVSNGAQSFAIYYYNNITWTTGDASGGNNGLGGKGRTVRIRDPLSNALSGVSKKLTSKKIPKNYLCSKQYTPILKIEISDVQKSFFLGTPAFAGFDAGDGVHRFEIPGSCNNSIINLANETNVGKPGVWVFQINNSITTPPSPTPPASTISLNSSPGQPTNVPSTPAVVTSTNLTTTYPNTSTITSTKLTTTKNSFMSTSVTNLSTVTTIFNKKPIEKGIGKK